jgi:hypothetical protein
MCCVVGQNCRFTQGFNGRLGSSLRALEFGAGIVTTTREAISR